MLKETNLAADTGSKDGQVDIAELMAITVCGRIDKGSVWTNINFHDLIIRSFLLKLFREMLQFPDDLDFEVFWYRCSGGDSPKTEQKTSFFAKSRRDQDDLSMLSSGDSEVFKLHQVLDTVGLLECLYGLLRKLQGFQARGPVAEGTVSEELSSLHDALKNICRRILGKGAKLGHNICQQERTEPETSVEDGSEEAIERPDVPPHCFERRQSVETGFSESLEVASGNVRPEAVSQETSDQRVEATGKRVPAIYGRRNSGSAS